jgi:two-component system OmpR family sensor kinase
LAHDLGNHLTPLKGHVDLLKRKAQQEGQGGYLALIDQASAAVKRIGELIGDLLNAARLEHGLFALSIADADLVLLIQEVAQRHESDKVPIHLRLPDQLLGAVDASQLCQALENLLSNAIRHSPEGIAVEIALNQETGAHGDWAVIDVRDEGPGIPADIVHTLFSRFSKGPGSQGLGLGLYLARGIAEAHGGTLTVQSTVGAGTTFRLSLPPPAGVKATSHASL